MKHFQDKRPTVKEETYKRVARLSYVKDNANPTRENMFINQFREDINPRSVRVKQPQELIKETEKPKENTSKYPFGVSVCISAWKTAEYIEECLDSVAAQTWFKNHDNWEILLGIDGCEETLAKVKEIMHKYKNLRVMMMDENVGTYVTCNTIMKEAMYEWLLRFDSDDVMYEDMVEKIFTHNLQKVDAIRYTYKNFEGNTQHGIAWGSHMVKKEVFLKYGGYQNWRIAADYDFLYRIEIEKSVFIMKKVAYKRRVRNNSLQYSPSTNMTSVDRLNKHQYILHESRKKPMISLTTGLYHKVIDNQDKITFIIPNRGGQHLQWVISNINTVFETFNKEIMIITQCDDDMFKKGQLYNIGLKFATTKWVALCDNDIIHLNKIDLFKEYENHEGRPYLGFSFIAQLRISGEKYIETSVKANNTGAGAFLFGKLTDFINVNGFSNLYIGWGCEDNEIACRLCGDNSYRPNLPRLEQKLGHITHQRRVQPKIFKRNQKTFFARSARNIQEDGIVQTTYNISNIYHEDNVIYVDVKNIGVVDNFNYKDLLG